MRKERVGFAMCGSFCTHEKVLAELRISKDKIACIAQRHGFRNQEYFTRFFKKKMGISPVKWRQQNFRTKKGAAHEKTELEG